MAKDYKSFMENQLDKIYGIVGLIRGADGKVETTGDLKLDGVQRVGVANILEDAADEVRMIIESSEMIVDLEHYEGNA